jgi:hypothetical protein
MKRKFKRQAIKGIAGIIAFIAVIGLSTIACDLDPDNGGNGSTHSLNGIWESDGGARITVSGSSGVFSAFGTPNPLGLDAISKDYWKLGNQYWRNLSSTGNLTWSGQWLAINHNLSSPNVATGTTWANATFVMSANGQTLEVISTTGTGSITYNFTRSNHSLNGVWETDSGMRITVSGSSGVFSAFGTLNPLGLDAVSKGYWTLGNQYWQNLSSTGNLTWSGQWLAINFNSSSPDVATGTTWANATFTVSANGQTVAVTSTTSTGSTTRNFTRKM